MEEGSSVQYVRSSTVDVVQLQVKFGESVVGGGLGV